MKAKMKYNKMWLGCEIDWDQISPDAVPLVKSRDHGCRVLGHEGHKQLKDIMEVLILKRNTHYDHLLLSLMSSVNSSTGRQNILFDLMWSCNGTINISYDTIPAEVSWYQVVSWCCVMFFNKIYKFPKHTNLNQNMFYLLLYSKLYYAVKHNNNIITTLLPYHYYQYYHTDLM